jgi:hypothetical protein
MRLSEIYIKEVILTEFWSTLEEDLEINEGDSGLTDLIGQANDLIFKKFNIDPTNRVYFIAGSARLYLYPSLREAFNLTGTIGDLDIVIPDKQLWINAGLESEYTKGGIYRPTNDGSVEVFDVWDPSKAGGAYADVKVRTTKEVMNGSTLVNGYYFMNLKDVMDYKTSLSRDKEKEVLDLVTQYANGDKGTKTGFLKMIIQIIGLKKAKDLLGIINK